MFHVSDDVLKYAGRSTYDRVMTRGTDEPPRGLTLQTLRTELRRAVNGTIAAFNLDSVVRVVNGSDRNKKLCVHKGPNEWHVECPCCRLSWTALDYSGALWLTTTHLTAHRVAERLHTLKSHGRTL